MREEELVELATSASRAAYAPYSGYRVGAALLSSRGSVYEGCNVENASYGLSMCAERVALYRAVSCGDTEFKAIAVVADGDKPPVPCGACLQAIAEFGREVRFILAAAGGGRQVWTLEQLLPVPFTLKEGVR